MRKLLLAIVMVGVLFPARGLSQAGTLAVSLSTSPLNSGQVQFRAVVADSSGAPVADAYVLFDVYTPDGYFRVRLPATTDINGVAVDKMKPRRSDPHGVYTVIVTVTKDGLIATTSGTFSY